MNDMNNKFKIDLNKKIRQGRNEPVSRTVDEKEDCKKGKKAIMSSSNNNPYYNFEQSKQERQQITEPASNPTSTKSQKVECIHDR